jgi:glycosyltransferase involved in cell wall biosynthesis
VASGGLYGIERMLLGLLPALRERGCPVELACLNAPDGPGGELGRAVAASAIPVHYAGLMGRLPASALIKIRRILRKTRPSLVHLHGYKATILAGIYSLARRLPTVATFHTHALHDAAVSSSIVRIEGHVLRRLRGIAAVSEPVRQELERRGVHPDRLRVIPNGIAEAYTTHIEDGPPGSESDRHPVLLCVGRLIRKKNVHLLIDAVAGLRAEFPQIRLLVAGEGEYREALRQQVEALRLHDTVQFLGFVDDVYRLLATCDAFVLPSQTEGMPIAVLEAMSFGVPIVASCVGSIPDIARRDREAVLVEPSDEQELTEALRRVLRDGALRRQLGTNARARFLAEFTAERMAERYLEFYQAVLHPESSLQPA